MNLQTIISESSQAQRLFSEFHLYEITRASKPTETDLEVTRDREKMKKKTSQWVKGLFWGWVFFIFMVGANSEAVSQS